MRAYNNTNEPQCALRFSHPLEVVIGSLRVVTPVDCSIDVELHRFGRWCGIVLSRWIAPGESVDFDIEHGTAPAGWEFSPRWLGAPSISPRIPEQLADFPLSDPEPTSTNLANRLRDASLTSLNLAIPDDVRAVRMRGLEILSIDESDSSATREDVRAAWMFWHFDNNTNPILLNERWPPIAWPDSPERDELSFRRYSMTRVVPVLTAGINRRLRAGAHAGPSREEPPNIRRAVAYLSTLQRMLIEGWYPHGAIEHSAIISSGLGRAFDQFACGNLRMSIRSSRPEDMDITLTEGGPNGIAVCMFTEFAVTACELGIDVQFWETLLPALVGMLDSYHRAYGELDAQGTPRRALPGSYPEGSRSVPRRRVCPPPNPRWHAWVRLPWHDIRPLYAAQLDAMFDGSYHLASRGP